MQILGIDYGRKKIGVALATSKLAEPYYVFRVKESVGAISEIKKIVDKEGVDRVVIGISEGEMAKEIRLFAKKLSQHLDIPIDFQDETLSTVDAQRLSREANISRKKRRQLEDAYAASIMLQSYIDNKLEKTD